MLNVPHIRPIETVESALRASDAGMRDADNAALHGVAIKTIRRCWALDLVDVPWRQSNWKTISVSARPGVARLDELIGLKS
jgi:hypothetical protein